MSFTGNRRDFFKQGAGLGLSMGSTSGLLAAQALEGLKRNVSKDQLIGELTATIPQTLSQRQVPGLSIAIIRDAQLLWTAGFGLKNSVTREPVTEDTIFEAASLSKPVFAYHALRFFEKTKRDLDTPLTSYVADSFIKGESRLNLVTARHVLSHTSGLPHNRQPREPIRLRFTPGDRFAYSATGILYLQFVIEELSRQKFRESVRAGILSPFGMNASSFGWIDQFRTQAATGHNRDGTPGLSGNGRYLNMTAAEKAQLEMDYPGIGDDADGAAGLYTTAADYARFMIGVMNPSRRDEYHLSDPSRDEMLKPQVDVTRGISWGLGWGLETTGSGSAFWHWGDWGVFRNFAIAFRQQGIGVVILTNSFNGPQAYQRVIPSAIGESHPAFAWVDSYRP